MDSCRFLAFTSMHFVHWIVESHPLSFFSHFCSSCWLLPGKYTMALMTGIALSGVIIGSVRIVTLAIWSNEENKTTSLNGAVIYFVIAGIINILSLFAYHVRIFWLSWSVIMISLFHLCSRVLHFLVLAISEILRLKAYPLLFFSLNLRNLGPWSIKLLDPLSGWC